MKLKSACRQEPERVPDGGAAFGRPFVSPGGAEQPLRGKGHFQDSGFRVTWHVALEGCELGAQRGGCRHQPDSLRCLFGNGLLCECQQWGAQESLLCRCGGLYGGQLILSLAGW